VVIRNRLKFASLFLVSLLFSAHASAMQRIGASNIFSYLGSSEQPMISIEPYQHERDYSDLYRLFNENNTNLGEWGYGDTFPQDNQVKVARWYDQLAGFVIYWQCENSGFISYIAVDQQIRSYGLGRILLHEAITDLKQQGADSVSLNVYEHNTKAQSLYERLGFYFRSANDGLMNYAMHLA
jgi:ribosomal protein S18 acetylase RimI-like enzyme